MLRNKSNLLLIYTLLFLCLFNINRLVAAACNNMLNVKVEDRTYKIPYCSNANLTSVNYASNAIFVIHGTNRNADDYYDYVKTAADNANDNSTLIVALQFPTISDIKKYGLPSDTLYWSSGGWKQGNKSQGDGRISSFAVLEQAISELIQVSPNLKNIIITGHSSGGQFVNRFTAGNSIEDVFDKIKFTYAPLNPSSYLYFSKHRALNGFNDTFAIPLAFGCEEYNDYKYGTDNLSKTGYMSSVGQYELASRYSQRNVIYMLGENDTKASSSFDDSCSAEYQGPNRFARGITYYNYLGFLYGDTIYENHQKIIVPRVGHNARKMYQSGVLREYFFNR